MRKPLVDVDAYLARSSHPRKDQVQRLRAGILAAHPEVLETVTWNAPSFQVRGIDRVTFRLQPGDRVELVLHRGLVAATGSDLTHVDDSGLVSWVGPDRGVVTVLDPASTDDERLAAHEADVVTVAARWMRT